jgi:DNA-binding response OmpR family regulator
MSSRAFENAKILLVEDEERYTRLITFNLKLEGYKYSTAATAAQALAKVEEEEFDLILLDLGLPDQDGISLCQEIRQSSLAPIIMVTARAGMSDKLAGLQVGADDYITKPFSIPELMMRIQTQLRRRLLYQTQEANPNPNLSNSTLVSIGDLQIDLQTKRVSFQGHEIILSAIEQRLLEYLARNAGRVLSKDMILEHVWGVAEATDSHLLRLAMSRLRQKLGTAQKYIHTRAGFGYILSDSPQ